MKKRFLSILLTALLLCAVPLVLVDTAWAASVVDSGSCGDKLTWSLSDDGTLTISGKGAMDNYKFDGYDYLANSYYTDAPWYTYHYYIKSVVIENGVTSIGDRAFYGCANLTSVTIPSSVASIGSSAFYRCYELTSVTIPSRVTSIGSNAFEECEYLTSVTIPYGVAEIGERTFYNCKALTSVTIPGSVTSIGEYAFYSCYELTSAAIPRGVTSIEDGTFRNCRELASVTIPDSVTSIGWYAFASCDALTSVVIPNSVTSIDSGAFSDCDALTSVTISANLTSIEDSVFDYCKSLKSVTIPRGVTAIGERAFYQCEALVSVTIPDTVTEIGSEAFSDCTSLRSAKIPKGVTKIAYGTFSRCAKLASVTIPDTVTSIEGCAFYECSVLPSVTIPSSVTSIGSSAFDSCGRLKNVTIPNSVTAIGGHAFSCCSSLTSVTISNGVTSIGSYAFSGCTSLASVTIPGSAASIGQSAFEGCEKLTSATILNGVTAIGERMFYDCNLASVTIPGSVTSIGEYAFYRCSSLTSVTIPSSVESIGRGAFSSCGSLTSVTIPDSVVSIGGYAFSGCKALSNITIPGGVTNIAEGVFKGCAALTSVTISKSVTSIDADAFYECSSLTDVYYDGTAADWEIITIDYGNENLTDAARHYVTLKPAAPTVKIGNSAASGKPQLTWRAVYGATSYRIYRSTSRVSGYSLLGTTTATSYTNTGAKAGTTYYYRVKACNDTGLSPYSNIVSGQVKSVTPKPSAPVVKIGHSATSGKPMLTWNAVSGATSYKVYRATSQNGTYSLLGTVTATSYTNTGAKAGTTYYYRVKACNDAGLSPYSNIVSGQVKTATPKPAAPVVRIGHSATSGKPMLTWNAVSGATSYKVYRATSQNGTYSLLGTVTVTSYTNTGAKAGVTYYYKVTAVNDSGESAFSNIVSGQSKAVTPKPSAPVVKIGHSASSGKPMLTWNAVSGATSYKVYRATSQKGTYSLLGTVTATSYTNTGAKAGTTYYYKVKAVNSAGESAYSNTVSGRATVTTLTMGHSSTSGKPQLTWKAVSGAASYKVYRATAKNGAYTVINTTKALTYTNTGAALGTTYYYKVEALSAAGKSMGFSAIVEGKVAPVLAVGYSSVSGKPQLTWKAVPGATEYQVYRSTQQNSGYKKINTTTSTSYVNTGAKAGTTYYYRIVAVKGTAASDFSNIVSARPGK